MLSNLVFQVVQPCAFQVVQPSACVCRLSNLCCTRHSNLVISRLSNHYCLCVLRMQVIQPVVLGCPTLLFTGCPTFCILVIQPHVMLVNQPCVCRLSNLLVSLGSPTLCFLGYPTFTMFVCVGYPTFGVSRLSNLVLCQCCVWHFTFPFPCYFPPFFCVLIPPQFSQSLFWVAIPPFSQFLVYYPPFSPLFVLVRWGLQNLLCSPQLSN